MVIFYVSHSMIPCRFANSVHVMKMCQAFADHGHRVVLFAKEGQALAEDVYRYYGVRDSFALKRFKYSSVPVFNGLKFVVDVVSDLKGCAKPDLYYSRHCYCLEHLGSMGGPVIYEAHQPPRNFVERAILRKFFGRSTFSRLVVISKPLLEEYVRIFPRLDRNKALVAHDGADAICEESLDSDDLLPGRPGALQIGYIGSLYRGRGLGLIAALAQMTPDADFHIVGGSKEEVEAQQRTFGHVHNLHWHGHIAPAAGDRYRSKMDILLAPYQVSVAVKGNRGNTVSWMSPLKVFEYMGSGRAIIASKLPTIGEVLQDGVDALLVEPDDLHGWKESIERLRDSELRETLGTSARTKLETSYTWRQRAASVLAGL